MPKYKAFKSLAHVINAQPAMKGRKIQEVDHFLPTESIMYPPSKNPTGLLKEDKLPVKFNKRRVMDLFSFRFFFRLVGTYDVATNTCSEQRNSPGEIYLKVCAWRMYAAGFNACKTFEFFWKSL